MPNKNIQNKMNPHPQYGRDSVGKISTAVMHFGNDNILLVEGKPDEILYKKFTSTKNINVFPVYGWGQYLDEKDSSMLGKKGDVSPKLSIILLVKRCFAREWAKGVIHNKFYGIVDRDFFLGEELELVNDSLLYNSTPMTEEDWKAYFTDAANVGRLTVTDTNDVETLIFKFDFDAVKNVCKFMSSAKLEEIKKKAIKKSAGIGFERYKSEENYNDGGSKNKKNPFPTLPKFFEDELYYCKGHDLVKIFYQKININQGRTVFVNERYFINSVINQTNINNYTNTMVYRFIKNI